MSALIDASRFVVKPNAFYSIFSNLLLKRNARVNAGKLIWKKPEELPFHHSECSGDLSLFKMPSGDTIRLEFQNSELLKNASEEAKKVFSLQYATPKHFYKVYEKELIDKVKRHEYDYSSLEVRLAKLTAKSTFYKYCYEKNPKNKKLKKMFLVSVKERQKGLEILQKKDYKKFEWILEQLNIIFRPSIPKEEVTRKKSLRLLAEISVKTEIETSRVKLQKSFDNQKVSFLEGKIEKLNWIKKTEELNDFPRTVTDADIADCINKLEKVKIELAQKMKEGYEKQIDPCTLEFYNEQLLRQKEIGEK